MENKHLPIVVIVGRPNVGKSALFNRLLGRKAAIVNEKAGTTRDRHYQQMDWNGREFILVDTGGLADKEDTMGHFITEQVDLAIKEADIILFLVDAIVGMTDQELSVARKLRKVHNKVLLAANKTDNEERKEFVHEFMRLGFGEPHSVSALQGIGTGDLLDALVEIIPETGRWSDAKNGKPILRLAIVGRPNVGKSTLVNQLTGEHRVIADGTPGTTRDSVDTFMETDKYSFVLIDTAGLRKRSHVDEPIEKQAGEHTDRSLERCDVTLLLLDGTMTLDEQDLRILTKARERGKGIIIGINKWDLVAKDDKTFDVRVKEMREKVPELEHVPFISLSALSGQRAGKVLEMAETVFARMEKNIAPQDLKAWLEECVEAHHHPSANDKFVNFYSVLQASKRPPVFEFKVNQPTKVRDSYTRYLKNRFNERFDMEGVPVEFKYSKKRRP
ncbi:MAG: ribosome biogenesis GTPase Der [Fibrobacteres bacterium]|nr:ribosome biogenesis GTPase Der [Fibrobacterota bacterium]